MMHPVDDDYGNDHDGTPDRRPHHGPRAGPMNPPAAPAPTPTRRSVQRRSLPLPSPPSSAERRRVRRMNNHSMEEKASPPPPAAIVPVASSSSATSRRNAPLPSSSSSSTTNGIHATATTPQRRRGGDTTTQRRQLHNRRSPSPRKSSPTPPMLPIHNKTNTSTSSTPNRNPSGHRRVHSSPGGGGGGSSSVSGVQIQRTMKRRINLARLCLGLAATLWVYAAASNYGMMRKMHDERRHGEGEVTNRGDDDGIMEGLPKFRDPGGRRGGGPKADTNGAVGNGAEGPSKGSGGGGESSKAEPKVEAEEEEPFVEVEPGSIPVFVPLASASSSDPKSLAIVSRASAMIESPSSAGKGERIAMYAQGPSARREFLVRHGAECYPPSKGEKNPILDRHDALPVGNGDGEDWRLQMFKYCALRIHGGVYLDPSDATLLQPLESIISAAAGGWGVGVGGGGVRVGLNVSVAVYNRARGLIHDSSLLALGRGHGGEVASAMLDRIMDLTSSLVPRDDEGTRPGDGDGDGLALPRTLHDLVMLQIGRRSETGEGDGGGEWTLLGQRCAAPLHTHDRHRVLAEERYGTCDASSKGTYCCHVLGPPVGGGAVSGGGGVAMSTRHFAALERPRQPPSLNPDSTNPEDGVESAVTRLVPLPANITSPTTTSFPAELPAPNFHDVMLDSDCLPNSNRHCLNFIESGGTCFSSTAGGGVGQEDCTRVCRCYCAALCSVRPRPKPVIKEFRVVPPGVGGGDGGSVGGGEFYGGGGSGRYIPHRYTR